MTRSIGLLHRGETGATAGVAARQNEERVVWALDGHSTRLRGRVEAAGLTGVGFLPATAARRTSAAAS